MELKMKKYQASHYFRMDIIEVEVEKETDSSVWVKGHRNAKRSADATYCDTWDEAHNILLEKAQIRVDDARNRLNHANDVLGNVKGMKKPNGENEGGK
jgi:hypothetical protein